MDRTIPHPAVALLDFIGDTEAPRGYGTIYANKQHTLEKPLTSMTIAEVQAAQGGWSKRHGSSAAGRYQFMKKTLAGLVEEMGLRTSMTFSADLQDRLAFHLLKRRGYDLFMARRISVEEFGKRLAMEWASLPVLARCQGAHRSLERGESYYAGDGVNKSLTKATAVEAILREMLEKPAPAPPKDHVVVAAPKRQSFWQMLADWWSGRA